MYTIGEFVSGENYLLINNRACSLLEVKKIHEICEWHINNLTDEDILRIRKESQEELQQYWDERGKELKKSKFRELFRRRSEEGFIYLMRDNRNGKTKIGFSKKPEYRESTLQSEQPDIELFFTAKGGPAKEKELHEKYSKYRFRGEWFDLPEECILEIKGALK